jgi:hypothetical protein
MKIIKLIVDKTPEKPDFMSEKLYKIRVLGCENKLKRLKRLVKLGEMSIKMAEESYNEYLSWQFVK